MRVFTPSIRWSPAWGALAPAFLAVVALGVSLGLARAGAARAAESTARGEVMLAGTRFRDELNTRPPPPTAELVTEIQERLRGSGLRYVALVVHGRWIEAGTDGAELARRLRPGELVLQDGLAFLAMPLPPPPRGGAANPRGSPEHPRPGGPADRPPPDGRSPPPGGPPGRPPPPGGPPGRPPADGPDEGLVILGVELAQTREITAGLDRAMTAGAIAAALLIIVAVALARDARRRVQKDRLAALGGMSAVMAHELMNPLASLKGHAQLLAEEFSPETPAGEQAERVVREAERMEALTRSLLAFVRDQPLAPERVAVAPWLSALLGFVPPGQLELALDRGPTNLLIDPVRLGSAVENLVRNALQAAPGDVVRVSLEQSGDTLAIAVEDRGPGLPPGDPAQLFEPFVTHRLQGTGLGLTIARRAVEQHGGRIEARGRTGGGACFRLLLPGSRAP